MKGCTVGVEQLGELEIAVARLREAVEPQRRRPESRRSTPNDGAS